MENKKINKKIQQKDDKYLFAELCIGKGFDKYIEIFKKITRGHFFIPSIPAGVFGLGWLLYRKVAKYGIVIYVLSVALFYILFKDVDSLSTFLKMVIIFGVSHVIFFFIGNFIYWAYVRRKIDFCRKTYGDGNAMTYLSEEGGTLKPSGIIASVLATQGLIMLIVYCLLSAESFFVNCWISIQELIKI